MLYFIKPVDTYEQVAVIQELVDFSWDSEQICIAPCNNGLLVDFGEPLGVSLHSLVKQMRKCVQPVAGQFCEVNWQVVSTHASPEIGRAHV